MRRIHPALIIGFVVILIVVVFVLIAKPTLVLPTQTITLAEGSPLLAYQRQLNIKELHVRVRTDGKAFVLSDGKEIAQLTYTPASFLNSVNLAEKLALSPDRARVIRLLPFFFPDLASGLRTTGLTVYYVLPLEMTIRFIPG